MLARWRRVLPAPRLPPERMLGAVRAGVRYVRHAPQYHAVLVRSAAFVLPAAALWALLPLVGRVQLALDATGYGILLGGLGIGAISGALLLPRLGARIALEPMLAIATVVFATTCAGLALVHRLLPAVGLTFLGGIAWMTVMSTLSVAAQESVPAWVRARALAVGLLAVQGSLAFGALAWGVVAAETSIRIALFAAAAALVASLGIAAGFRLPARESLDLTRRITWTCPCSSAPSSTTKGPCW